jgi:hypothetical protein
MGDLSERDVEDVLGGVQPPGRDDLAPVVELTTWLHVSREIEPPPAMRDDLFCQIEDGLRVYQRSSRRAPAHLRRRRTSTSRVRDALAGSGRPIVSVAAAAVLLVGVILAVRAGGPSREPSAFVSPAARGVPSTASETTTTTTTAPTTTSPSTSTPDAATPAETGSTVSDSEHSATTGGATESPAPTDTPTARPRSQDDDETPPTTEERRGERDEDRTPDSVEHRPGRDTGTQSGATADPDAADHTEDTGDTDDTESPDLPLSGWDFDLSEWPAVQALWDALQAEERGEPRSLGEDPDGARESDDEGDDDGDGDRDGDGERDGDGVNDRPDADDAESEPRVSD